MGDLRYDHPPLDGVDLSDLVLHLLPGLQIRQDVLLLQLFVGADLLVQVCLRVVALDVLVERVRLRELRHLEKFLVAVLGPQTLDLLALRVPLRLLGSALLRAGQGLRRVRRQRARGPLVLLHLEFIEELLKLELVLVVHAGGLVLDAVKAVLFFNALVILLRVADLLDHVVLLLNFLVHVREFMLVLLDQRPVGLLQVAQHQIVFDLDLVSCQHRLLLSAEQLADLLAEWQIRQVIVRLPQHLRALALGLLREVSACDEVLVRKAGDVVALQADHAFQLRVRPRLERLVRAFCVKQTFRLCRLLARGIARLLHAILLIGGIAPDLLELLIRGQFKQGRNVLLR